MDNTSEYPPEDISGVEVCTCGHTRFMHDTKEARGCVICNCIAFRLEEARLLR